MAYTPTPNFVPLNIFQWELPDAPNPRLSASITDTSATVFTFTAAPKDKDKNIITGNFLANVRNESGYTENYYVPSGTLDYDAQTANFTVGEIIEGATSGARAIVVADVDNGTSGTLTLAKLDTTAFQDNEVIAGDAGGSAEVDGVITNSMSADGLTASNIVRGVRLNGLDFFTSDPTLAAAHEINAPVRCVVSPVYNQIVFDWIRGQSSLGSGGNRIIVGDGSASNNSFAVKDDTGVIDILRRNDATNKAQFSNDGTVWNDLDGVGSHGTTAPLKDHGDVAASASDSPADDDLFIYNTGSGEWRNETINAALGATKIEISQLSGTNNIAEADTFFGATDATGAEMETLTNGSDASGLHYLNPIVNLDNTGRVTIKDRFVITGTTGTGTVTTSTGEDYAQLSTGATSGSTAFSTSSMSQLTASLHDKNPEYFAIAKFSATTDQDASLKIGGGNPSGNVLTAIHAGFLVSNNTMVASVSDGATQSTSGALTVTLTDLNSYRVKRVGASYKFYINNVEVADSAVFGNNIPASTITVAPYAAIANTAAANKQLTLTNHYLSFDI